MDASIARVHNGATPCAERAAKTKLSDFLTVGEAAVYLGVSQDTLRRWDRSGKLVARRHPMTEFRLYLTTDLDLILAGISRSSMKRAMPAKTVPKKGKSAIQSNSRTSSR